MTKWLERSPLRWLVRALLGGLALAVLQLVAGALLRAGALSEAAVFARFGLGAWWGVASVVFLFAFPLGAEALGIGATPAAIARLLGLSVAIAFVSAQLGGMKLLDPTVLLLGVGASLACAISGRQRYLFGLGLGLVAALALVGPRLVDDLSGKNVLSWLVVGLLVYGPAVVIATLLAVGEKLSLSTSAR